MSIARYRTGRKELFDRNQVEEWTGRTLTARRGKTLGKASPRKERRSVMRMPARFTRRRKGRDRCLEKTQYQRYERHDHNRTVRKEKKNNSPENAVIRKNSCGSLSAAKVMKTEKKHCHLRRGGKSQLSGETRKMRKSLD